MSEIVADTAEPVAAQHDIELPNGIVLSGNGGDAEAIREQAEDRQEERATGKSKAPESAAPSTSPTPDADMSRTQRRRIAQEKIDGAVAKQREAERRAEAAEQRVKDFEARTAAASAPPVAPAQPGVRPKPSSEEVGTKYQSYEDFIEDLADWKSEQKVSSYDASLRQRIEAEQASRSFNDTVTSVLDRGRKAYDDFDAVRSNPDGGGYVTLGPNMEVHGAKVQQILSLPNAEHVLYQVCQSKALAQELAAIDSPFAFGVRLAQLIHTPGPAAAAAPARPSVPMTNAPQPMQPVGTSSRTSEPSLLDLAKQDDYDSSGYRERRRAELRAVR